MAAFQPLPRTSPESVGIPSIAINAFLNHVEQSGVELHSLMIVRHGKVCAEGWWKPYGPDKIHNIHSFTKTFLSTALGIVVSRGKLSLDDPVLSFFPEDAPQNPSENLKKMKVWHLLTMNTGHHDEPPVRGEKDFVRAFLAAPVDHEPGSWFRYNSNASHMIGRIIHRVTGKTFIEILQSHLFEPMGFGKYECANMADGFPAGGGGLAILTEDMARLAQLYLNRGQWNGEQLVPKEWIAAATVPQCDNSNGVHHEGREDWEAGYGYQLWMNHPFNSYRFDGAHGQIAAVCPEQDMAVIFNSATTKVTYVLDLVWRFITNHVFSDPLPENPMGHALLSDRMANLRLPELRTRGTSLLQGGVCGKRIAFRPNEVPVLPASRPNFGASEPKPGLSSIVLGFKDGKLELLIHGAEGSYEITAGMDGEAVENVLSVAGTDVPYVASAVWTDQNVLSVTWRQIRVVCSATMNITYHMDGADVSIRHFPLNEEFNVHGTF